MSSRTNLVRIASIVAGHGEVASVPRLIGRIAREVAPTAQLICPVPIRASQDGFIQKASERERSFDQARGRAGPNGAILVLLDSEGALPCQLGPALLKQILPLGGSCHVGLVLAHQEYEAWFLAGVAPLAGYKGLPIDLRSPTNPEGIRDAKGWLTQRMRAGQKYSPREDQADLTRRFDIEQARRAGSFDKCYREIERLISTVCRE